MVYEGLMILECPSCTSRFKIAQGAIPGVGRMVRCSRCKNAWHVNPWDLKDDNAVVEAVAPGTAPVQAVNDTMPASVEVEGESTRMPDPEPAAVLDDDFMKRLDKAISDAPPQGKRRPTPTRRKDDVKPFINPRVLKLAAPALAATWFIVAFFAYSPSWSNAPVIGALYSAFGASETEGLVFSDVTMEREQEGSMARFILAGSVRNYSNETRKVPTVRVVLKNKEGSPLWGREYPVNQELKAGEVYPFRITNVETNFAASVARIEVDMGNSMQLLVR